MTTAAVGISHGTDGRDGSQAPAPAAASRLTRDELIGRVVALQLWERLTSPEDGLAAGNGPASGNRLVAASDGAPATGATARFIVDCLTGAQTRASQNRGASCGLSMSGW